MISIIFRKKLFDYILLIFRQVYTNGKQNMEEQVEEVKVSAEEIGLVATHADVKARALAIVKKKLGHLLGRGPNSEVREISEDALNTVTMSLLNACSENTTTLRAEQSQTQKKDLTNPVVRYLMSGVSNYCDTRLKRWSVGDENGEVGTRARYTIPKGRADDSEFWDQHLTDAGNLDSLDEERVDRLLSAKGVSEADIDLIKRNLAGWSFVELARELGGTEDKYRRRIRRALDTAGIDANSLK